MRNHTTLTPLMLAAVVAAVIAVNLGQPSPVVAAGNPGASGHVNLDIFGGLQTYSFNAIQHRDGTVSGHLVAKSRGQDARIFAEMDCLNLFGNVAVMSGEVTQSNNPAFPEGFIAIFTVVDNGEGANDPPDLVSDVVVLPPGSDCFNFIPSPDFVVEEGNVQVQP
jgi:hypothetical protein